MFERVLAAFAYLPFVGWLAVLVNRSPLVKHHTRQSLILFVLTLLTFAVWVVFSWLIAFIPYVGAILAVSAFALVVAVALYLLSCAIMGGVAAARGYLDALPITRR